MLCLRLKCSRGKLLPSLVVGPVAIEVHDVLNQCLYDEREQRGRLDAGF